MAIEGEYDSALNTLLKLVVGSIGWSFSLNPLNATRHAPELMPAYFPFN